MDSKSLQCLPPAYPFTLSLNQSLLYLLLVSLTDLPLSHHAHHQAFVRIVSSSRKPFPFCLINCFYFRYQLSHYFFEKAFPDTRFTPTSIRPNPLVCTQVYLCLLTTLYLLHEAIIKEEHSNLFIILSLVSTTVPGTL